MPKSPNEAQVWAGAYSIALALLTFHYGEDNPPPVDLLDERARAIADRAVKTLTEKGVI